MLSKRVQWNANFSNRLIDKLKLVQKKIYPKFFAKGCFYNCLKNMDGGRILLLSGNLAYNLAEETRLSLTRSWEARDLGMLLLEVQRYQTSRTENTLIGSLRKPRRRRQRERRQTKALMSKTIAVHVRYKSLYTSCTFSAKQQREMTKFCVVY